MINKTRTRSDIGRANKRLGSRTETESAKFWSSQLNSKIVRTPRSGGISSFPGDLMDLGLSIIKEDDWIIDIKGGESAVPKRIKDQMNKLKDDALISGSQKYWLEITEPYRDTYIILNRKIFAQLLFEVQEWRKQNK